ncbi:MAG TPA: hypothetical protein DD490_17315 [Acidobacteria bacterium]|nr:hypothetical protein [Acidobacteriota bacterium]
MGRASSLPPPRGAARDFVVWALLTAAASPLVAAPPVAVPHVGPNLRLHGPQRPAPDGQIGRVGSAVATDAAGRLVLAAWETLQGSCGPPFGKPCPAPVPPGLTAVGASSDGGRTWTELGAPPPVGDSIAGGHPWLDRGGADRQTFYLVNRARHAADRSQQTGLTFHRGHFKEGSFVWDDGKLLAPAVAGDVLRGPSLAAAKDGSGKLVVGYGNLRKICGQPGRSAGQIELLRSSDGGVTWEGPAVVSPDDTAVTADPADPACGSPGTFQFATSVALGLRDEVYVLWQAGPVAAIVDGAVVNQPVVGIRFARSLDGGKTFQAPRDLARVNGLWENPAVGYSKDNLNNFPRLAVAPAGPHAGRLYVTYAGSLEPVRAPATGQSLVSSEIYLISSDDQGATWSPPRLLAGAVPPTGVKRFWPTVAVEPDGAVDVTFLESRETQATSDPGDVECRVELLSGATRAGSVSSLADVWWVRSTDGGAGFGAPIRVTSQTSNWCATRSDRAGLLFANFGDYLGLAAAGGRLFAVWTDGRDGVPDAYVAELRSQEEKP